MNILILNDREPIDLDYLTNLQTSHQVAICQSEDVGRNLKSIFAQHNDAQILVTTYMDLSASNLALLPHLHSIVTTTTGIDFIDSDFCSKRDIKIYNNPGYTKSAVADHLLALMLGAGRHVASLDAKLRQGDFNQFEKMGFEFDGKTIGIVGFGNIGQRFAKYASALDLDIQFYNRSSIKSCYRQVEFDTLISTSDVIALTIPLNKDTQGLISQSVFSSMKKGSLLVSISADEVIDIVALKNALADGTLFAAGLDLHKPQPSLNSVENALLTPTKAWYTNECNSRRIKSWLNVLNRIV